MTPARRDSSADPHGLPTRQPTPTDPDPRTHAGAHHDGPGRSYLLRVCVQPGGCRCLVQDLKTGERREFLTEAELGQFVAQHGQTGLR